MEAPSTESLKNPDQWNVLKGNPVLLRTALEDIVRWTSPVVQFARTASEDYTLRGQRIKRGDSLVLYYPSANRDKDVFKEPFKFDISRVTPIHMLRSGLASTFASEPTSPASSSR